MKRLVPMLLLAGCTKTAEAPKESPPKNLAEHAERLGRRITDDGARALLIAELGAAFARAERTAEGAPFLEEAEEVTGKLDDPIDRESVLSALAGAQALSGNVEKAKQTAKRIGAPDARSATLAEIVQQLAARKSFEGARDLIGSISEPEWKATAEVHLVKALLAAGELEGATRTSSRIQVAPRRDEAVAAIAIEHFRRRHKKAGESALDSVKSPHWRAEAVAARARLQYRRGARKKGIEAAQGIESHWIRARTYAELSGMAGRAGRNREARRLLEQSIGFAEDIQDSVMRATALTDVAMRLIDRGHVDGALEVLEKAPRTATRHKADAHLAGYFARKGELVKAYEVHQRLETDVIWGSEAASQIAKAHAAQGDFARALEAAARIKTRELRLPALAEIAVAHTIAGAPIDPAIMEKLEQALFTGAI